MIELHVYLVLQRWMGSGGIFFFIIIINIFCAGWGAWSVHLFFSIILIRGINILLLFCVYYQCYFIV